VNLFATLVDWRSLSEAAAEPHDIYRESGDFDRIASSVRIDA
jgi:hypothetical protein